MTPMEFILINDICDKMRNSAKLFSFMEMLGERGIRPLLSIIPENQDTSIMDGSSTFQIEEINDHVKDKQIIGLGGYQHKNLALKNNQVKGEIKSEFLSMPLMDQRDRIVKGYNIIKERMNNDPVFFVPPWGSFDNNTLRSLKEISLPIVSGINKRPYLAEGVIHYPLCGNLKQKKGVGLYFIEYSPSNYRGDPYEKIIRYIDRNRDNFNTDFGMIQRDPRPHLGKKDPYYEFSYKISKKAKGSIKALTDLISHRELLTGYLKRRKLLKLQKKYQFELWHLSPLEWRPYAQDLVQELNRIFRKEKLETVCEVGCGLGEILNSLEIRRKVGIDREKNVIDAARELHPKINFELGSFNDVKNDDLDMLIAVNFTQHIDPTSMSEIVKNLTASRKIKYLAMDENYYPYHHDFGSMLKGYDRIWYKEGYEFDRKVIIFKRNDTFV